MVEEKIWKSPIVGKKVKKFFIFGARASGKSTLIREILGKRIPKQKKARTEGIYKVFNKKIQHKELKRLIERNPSRVEGHLWDGLSVKEFRKTLKKIVKKYPRVKETEYILYQPKWKVYKERLKSRLKERGGITKRRLALRLKIGKEERRRYLNLLKAMKKEGLLARKIRKEKRLSKYIE